MSVKSEALDERSVSGEIYDTIPVLSRLLEVLNRPSILCVFLDDSAGKVIEGVAEYISRV